jgi:PTH1 family peptidyl-tRNA hydrolase
MNLCGQSIKACADFYDIDPGNTLIIHDDLDLPLGKIKVVKQGGSGGHRGVQSIFNHLGNRDLPRAKIGIGRPKYGETTEDYVLSPFYESEKEIIDEVMGVSLQVCKLFIQEGIVTTMNRINRNKQKLKEGLI